ncbi:MAG: alpha/beta fold hydrolase [Nanoarchaeota archaeon]
MISAYAQTREAIAYYQWGALHRDAHLMLCMHSYGLNSSEFDRTNSSLVHDGITSIGFDVPGHGKSPFTAAQMDVDYEAATICGQLHDNPLLNDRPLTLMGHCMGGLTAIRTARKLLEEGYDHLRSLIILTIGANIPRGIPRTDQQSREFLESHLCRETASYVDFSEMDGCSLGTIQKAAFRNTDARTLEYFAQNRHQRLHDDIEHISAAGIPVLFVAAAMDPLVSTKEITCAATNGTPPALYHYANGDMHHHSGSGPRRVIVADQASHYFPCRRPQILTDIIRLNGDFLRLPEKKHNI